MSHFAAHPPSNQSINIKHVLLLQLHYYIAFITVTVQLTCERSERDPYQLFFKEKEAIQDIQNILPA